ncbi:hypothetical protein BH10PSE5_BH10PSE5_34310 [soil metagenome]
MIIHINGYPGVGKLTVGKILAAQLGGRLLDQQAMYDVAFALAEFRTTAWDEIARGVRDVAFRGVEAIAPSIPIITTNACSDSDWGREIWAAMLATAGRRGSPFLVVSLACSPEENARRVQSEDRRGGKMSDPLALEAYRQNWRLLEDGGDGLLRLDCTSLSPDVTAQRIAAWVGERPVVAARAPT